MRRKIIKKSEPFSVLIKKIYFVLQNNKLVRESQVDSRSLAAFDHTREEKKNVIFPFYIKFSNDSENHSKIRSKRKAGAGAGSTENEKKSEKKNWRKISARTLSSRVEVFSDALAGTEENFSRFSQCLHTRQTFSFAWRAEKMRGKIHREHETGVNMRRRK